MARIRSIKPEFPQSESMGRVSRDARLLFIQLWTLCDDEGRARAASRMLASLLFPYDDDAPALIDSWLEELEREGCLVRYHAEGGTYLQVCKWLNHQKIDKPSKSKIPPFDDDSQILARPRELSCEDQGSRIKDQGEEKNKGADAPAPKVPRFDPRALDLPDGLSQDKWDEWVSYRSKRRLSLTEQTAVKQLAMLSDAIAAGHSADEMIDASITNGWQGLFVPKRPGGPPAARSAMNRIGIDSQTPEGWGDGSDL